MTKRRDLFDPTDPGHFQSEQRLTEVAAILAGGVIRMREQRAVTVPKVRPCGNRIRSTGSPNRRPAACTPKILPESGETRLEVSRPSRPDGRCG